MMKASFLPGELGGEAAAKHRGQKLRCMNQRETIPKGESSKKYAETPVGSLPTGVSFVAFCSFPGLSVFYPRMGQIWVKGLTHSLTQIVLKAKWRKNAIFKAVLEQNTRFSRENRVSVEGLCKKDACRDGKTGSAQAWHNEMKSGRKEPLVMERRWLFPRLQAAAENNLTASPSCGQNEEPGSVTHSLIRWTLLAFPPAAAGRCDPGPGRWEC